MRRKAVLLLDAAPRTDLMNSFRIGVIGILVNSYGIEHAEGFLHFFEGWIIFLACIGILFLMAIGLQQLRRESLPLRDAIDVDFDGFGAIMTRIFSIQSSRAMVVALGVTVAVSGAFLPLGTPKGAAIRTRSTCPTRPTAPSS